MAERIETLLNKAELALEWSLAIMMGSMTTIIFLQVIYRYILQSPLAWSEELARFLFIWITFIGAVIAARKGSHISVELLQNLFSLKIKKSMMVISFSLTSAFFGLIVYFAVFVFDKMMAQTSPAMGLPMGYPYMGLIIGCSLLCIIYAIKAISLLFINDAGYKQ